MTALDRTSLGSAQGHPLDSVVWSALTGPHAHLAQGTASALRYPPDISPFATLAVTFGDEAPRDNEVVPRDNEFDRDDERADDEGLTDASWADLAALVGRGGVVTLAGPARTIARLPAGWQVMLRIPGVQMVATDALSCEPDAEAVVLGAEDVPEMLDLVRRAEPGPFLARTHELGTYLGIRRGGALVAMAGERMHPPGWIELSAVCTDPAFRGQGLAARLIKAVAHGIRDKGARPFLHAAADNTAAIGLYESLGFVVRRRPEFFFLQVSE